MTSAGSAKSVAGSHPDRATGLRGCDVVVLLASQWAALADRPTRWCRLVEVLARRGPASITVVSYPRLRRRALLTGRDSLARAEVSWAAGVGARSVVLPVGPDPGLLDGLATRRTAAALNGVLPGDHGSRLVIATHPVWADVAVSLPARLRLFDAFDDWRHRPTQQRLRGRIVAGYARLHRFDAVTANSQVWAQDLAGVSGVRPLVVGNGVDLAEFADPGPAPDGLPDRPFALYVGTIETRVDVDLLDGAARRLPHVPIVVAGPADARAQRRLESAHLHWLGPVARPLVPGLLRRAGVGLIPHRSGPWTASMDPLKLLEYLAAGLPVVATSVPVPAPLEATVSRADDAETFAAAIAAALAGGRRPVPDYVAAHDWELVADRFVSILRPRHSTGKERP